MITTTIFNKFIRIKSMTILNPVTTELSLKVSIKIKFFLNNSKSGFFLFIIKRLITLKQIKIKSYSNRKTIIPKQ